MKTGSHRDFLVLSQKENRSFAPFMYKITTTTINTIKKHSLGFLEGPACAQETLEAWHTAPGGQPPPSPGQWVLRAETGAVFPPWSVRASKLGEPSETRRAMVCRQPLCRHSDGSEERKHEFSSRLEECRGVLGSSTWGRLL